MRTRNEYTKMTENERAYKGFYCKITNFFQKNGYKSLYSPKVCDIINEMDG